jgi:hypothetical protein
MNVFASARAYGVTICFADLGDWGDDELRSEYDPHGPTIRLNLRVAQTLAPDKLGTYVVQAIAHELYHHREHLGEIAVIADRIARERAADDFARAFLADRS